VLLLLLLSLLLLPAVLFNGTTEDKAAWVALRWVGGLGWP